MNYGRTGGILAGIVVVIVAIWVAVASNPLKWDWDRIGQPVHLLGA